MLPLTDQHLITELSTPTSGREQEVAHEAIFNPARAPENSPVDTPAHNYPSTQSCLPVEETRRLWTEQPVTLDLFPMVSLNQKPDHLDRDTLDDSVLPAGKRLKTSTSNDQDNPMNQDYAMQDSTPNPTFPCKDKQPMENRLEKSLHSNDPDTSSWKSNKKHLNIFELHHLEYPKESPGINTNTGILVPFTSGQIATLKAYQLMKTLKDEAASNSYRRGDISRKVYVPYDVICHVNKKLDYPKGKSSEYI
jgi:hypothetical protein